MRIVIVGDGKVGFTLAGRLSAEGHDLVIIDNNPKNLEGLDSALDVNTVLGNGASLPVLREAEVEESDLLIAVTSMDEINLISCLVARKLGVSHTVARIRNPDYFAQMMMLKEELGLSMVVNPEHDTAKEIARLLRFPSAIKIETFARGLAELVEYRIPENSALCNLPLSRMSELFRVHVLVCAVRRGDTVHVPSGNFVLQSGDYIHITTPSAELGGFFKRLGVPQARIRDVMLIGGGRIAYYLARHLDEYGMQVKIIERDVARAELLSEQLPKALIINGDGTDPDLLSEEGLENTDAFVALTGMDEENIIISLYAKTRMDGKVITKADRLTFLPVLGDMGLESLVSPKTLTANAIVSFVRGSQNGMGSNVETMHELIDGRIEALEFNIRPKAEHLGVPLMDLPLKPEVLIGCIVRKGRAIIPAGRDTIEVGDSVVVITTSKQFRDYNDIFRS